MYVHRGEAPLAYSPLPTVRVCIRAMASHVRSVAAVALIVCVAFLTWQPTRASVQTHSGLRLWLYHNISGPLRSATPVRTHGDETAELTLDAAELDAATNGTLAATAQARRKRYAADTALGLWSVRIVCALDETGAHALASVLDEDETVPCNVFVAAHVQASRYTNRLTVTLLQLGCTTNSTRREIEAHVRTHAPARCLRHPALPKIGVHVTPDRYVSLPGPEAVDHDPAHTHAKKRDATQVDDATYTQPSAPWHLDRIDQRRAPPLDNLYSYSLDGAGVTIYVLDTGGRVTHSQFGNRAEFIANTVGDGINTDCHGHGTHVGGIAAGTTYGVAKKALIKFIKVLDCNGGGSSTTVTLGAMDVVARQSCTDCSHAAVINLSLSGGASSTMDAQMRDMLELYQVPVIAAAGNRNGADACLYSPGREPTAVTVAATGNPSAVDDAALRDPLASFSDRGPCVDLGGPGVSIVSAYYTSDTATAIMSGTSMATPIVAGLHALAMQFQAAADPASRGYDAIAAVKAVATSSRADDPNDIYAAVPMIYGRIEQTSYVAPMPPPPPPPPPPPSDEPVTTPSPLSEPPAIYDEPSSPQPPPPPSSPPPPPHYMPPPPSTGATSATSWLALVPCLLVAMAMTMTTA